MDRTALLDDAQWDLIEPLLPPQRSGRGRPMREHRQVVEGVIYRYRCGIPWRDLPSAFGPWQTVWKRHRRFSGDGTWDKVLAALLAQADAVGEIDWNVSVDSTINRAHQHGTNLPRGEKTTDGEQDPAPDAPVPAAGPVVADAIAGAIASLAECDTGGFIELQESAGSRRSAAR